MTPKYFIFDMDGVLVDSEPMHCQIIYEVFQQLEIQFPKSYIEETLTGMSAIPMWKKIKEDALLSKSAEELLQFHRTYFYERFEEIEVTEVEGVKNVIQKLKNHGFSLALASSSSRKLIDYFTKKIHISHFFDVIMSGDDVKFSKPFPEIFTKVAQWYQADSKNFWVLEDSKNGVQAAKSAGMNCIGFKNPNSGNQDLSKSDLLIHSMNDITDDFIENLIKINEKSSGK
ncbi:HAD family hydrolase [Capnocytophaga cynodegmi]|uniref:HAD hydrolase, family IA, variant 3 n=1 Tax=Capnocytophaga cynodegmi TaxID=28189 RepID=A0A0B7HJP6_9FLAO|nr:HAD family phosphatase [Capnocytophaga cynodegmi]CEN34771.1 HAD hydrolase, family IA, variant 3 [Capnocytophaga cynodegmi]CEN38879.1 HAD hydrolase, family IA, variant 3 [Capnocytophaga cynodegmi]